MAQPEKGEDQTDAVMVSRLDFVRAIKGSQHNNPKRECDFVPAAELVGIFAAYGAVSRMLFEGKLEHGPAAFLNATLTLHAFNVWHCCSHEALAAHNDAHEPFQNLVTRLCALLLSYGDIEVSSHKRHHRYTNSSNDPDTWMLEPLAAVGEQLVMALEPEADGKLRLGAAHKDFVMQAAVAASIELLLARDDTRRVGEMLQIAHQAPAFLTGFILVLFFGRYPHLRGSAKTVNEINSFYNTTWRGQGQVDLWMMGEGWHHGHHAVSDVNYTVLSKVAADVEASHPTLKTAFRGNSDLGALEEGTSMPPHLTAETSEPCQQGWERTKGVRAEIDRLLDAGGSPAALKHFVTAVAESAINNALRVATTADCSLLRHLHQQMGLKGRKSSGPDLALPVGEWHETVFSARTQELLREQASGIRDEVLDVAAAAGAAFAPSVSISSKEDIKEHYLEFFKAVGSALVDSSRLWKLLEDLAATLPAPRTRGSDPEQLLARVRSYLETPLPKDSRPPEELNRPQGSKEDILQIIADVLGMRPPASRL